MSSELGVKEFSCISYFLFSHNSCDHCASALFHWLQFKRPNPPDDPNCSPSTTIVCISDSLQLKEEGDLHREDNGSMMMGLYIEWWGRGGGWHDDDGEGCNGDMMMLDPHLMVDRHFMIRIISLATVSLLWLGSSDNFPPMCTKTSLMLLYNWWISCMNLYSSMVDEYRLFMELMQIPKASDLLSWILIFIFAVFFAVIFFAYSISLLFASTCLYCATLTAVR